jgi:hypothetical protein
MFSSSVEEGKLWPKAMARVVRPARVPTTPRWLPPAAPPYPRRGALSRTDVAVYSLEGFGNATWGQILTRFNLINGWTAVAMVTH